MKRGAGGRSETYKEIVSLMLNEERGVYEGESEKERNKWEEGDIEGIEGWFVEAKNKREREETKGVVGKSIYEGEGKREEGYRYIAR